MPKFLVSQDEWAFAHQHLDNSPNGTKLPYSAILSQGVLHQRKGGYFSCYQTTHSFIKINGKIYALAQGKSKEAIAGKGEFGVVKFMMDETNTSHVVKIQNFFDDNETYILESLGYSAGTNKRGDKAKYYTHMANMGESLADHIPLLKTEDERFKIAIDICLKLDRLHQGHDDKNHCSYAHLDIKPQNITIDEQGDCHYVDFGLSEKDAQGVYFPFTGTFQFMPAGCHTDNKNHTRQQYDMLALKRTLFMPTRICCNHPAANPYYQQSQRSCLSVLSHQMLLDYQLDSYIDTSDENTYFREDDRMNSSTLAALLINAHLNLHFENKDLINQPLKALAISTLYAKGFKSASELLIFLKNTADANLCAMLGERDLYSKFNEYQLDKQFMSYMEKASTLTAARALLDMKDNQQSELYAVIVDEQSALGKSLSLLEQHGLQQCYQRVMKSPDLYHFIASNPSELTTLKTIVLDNPEHFSAEELKHILDDKALRNFYLYVYKNLKTMSFKEVENNLHIKCLIEFFYRHPEIDSALLQTILVKVKVEHASLWNLFYLLALNGDSKKIQELLENFKFINDLSAVEESVKLMDLRRISYIDQANLLAQPSYDFISVSSYLYRQGLTKGIDLNLLHNKNFIKLLGSKMSERCNKNHIEAIVSCYLVFGYDENRKVYQWIERNRYDSAISIVNNLYKLNLLNYLPLLINKNLNNDFFDNLNKLLNNEPEKHSSQLEFILKSELLQDCLDDTPETPTWNHVTAYIALNRAEVELEKIPSLDRFQIKSIELVSELNPKNGSQCYKKILTSSNWSHYLSNCSSHLQKQLMLKTVDWSMESMEFEKFYEADEVLGTLLNFSSTLEEARHYIELSKILVKLNHKLEKFDNNGSEKAAEALKLLILKITRSMATLATEIKNDDFPDINSFRNDCIQANKDHRSELEQHRGIIGVLDTFLTILASLIVFYPIVYGVQKWQNIQYSFFKTDTCKIQDEFDGVLGVLGSKH
jgi:serine/threonine protein kinase